MPTFYQMYANAFQDIHVQSSARDLDFRTMPYGSEIYASMPTPLEEILKLVDIKVQQLQAPNRMTGFNFETCRGPIQWDPIPPYQSPIEENAWKTTTIRRDGETRLERYRSREQAYKLSLHNQRSQLSTSSAEAEIASRARQESL